MVDHNRSHSALMKVSSVSGSKLLTVERLNSARNSAALSKGAFQFDQDPERQSESANREQTDADRQPFEAAQELEKLARA